MIGMIFSLCNDDLTKIEKILETPISLTLLFVRYQIQKHRKDGN